MDIANFPSLTVDEFEEACHHLDRKYRRATLGMLRMRWKLRVRTALEQRFLQMPRILVEITRVLEQPEEDLDLDLGVLGISEDKKHDNSAIEADYEMMEEEAADEVRQLL